MDYPSGVVANDGNVLTPSETKDKPELSWSAQEDQLYTLVMTDPDAPTRSFNFVSQVKHWLVINIPGSDVDKGETIADYQGPGPPPLTGLHRYVFLVYKQPDKIETDEKRVGNSIKGRMRFKAREFAKKHNLDEPIAANFYQSRH